MSTRKNKFKKEDKLFMNLALNLARSRHGLTGKNPSVGCVIVKNNQIISIGQTGINGRPHAEYNAINNCTENLQDSSMYVTLEPCNHYGLTPPCTKNIIKNKIKKVYYGIDDIDKKVRGKSKKILNKKNLIVAKGLLKNIINNFYKPYKFNRKYKMPYVTGKIAISKNSLIYSKGFKKITDIYSDKFTHLLRYKNDAIMVSYKTLNKDNPKLNCRLEGFDNYSSKKIILDNLLKTKTNSYIFKKSNIKNTIVFYNEANKKKIQFFKKKGINLIKSKLEKNGFFNLKLILKKIYILGCRNILVEGGNDLTKNFLKKKLFNQFYLFKSLNNLPKNFDYKEFNSSNILLNNYKQKIKINKKFGKDVILLYKK